MVVAEAGMTAGEPEAELDGLAELDVFRAPAGVDEALPEMKPATAELPDAEAELDGTFTFALATELEPEALAFADEPETEAVELAEAEAEPETGEPVAEVLEPGAEADPEVVPFAELLGTEAEAKPDGALTTGLAWELHAEP